MGSLDINSTCALNDGTKIPYRGLGVYASSTCTKACLTSFDEGYRHIDTAQLYGNEEEVGVSAGALEMLPVEFDSVDDWSIQEAIRTSSLPRSSLFVTSKVWDNKHTREQSHKAVVESLELMYLDQIDLYLIHNPSSGPAGRHQAWLGLQDAL